MKKTGIAIALIFILVILINFGIYSFDEAACSGTLIVTVNSPQDKVYTSHNVVISISASDPAKLTGPEAIAYSLDGGPQIIIATALLGMHNLNGSTVLSMSNGRHEIVGIGITWFNGTTDGIFFSKPVCFTVDSPIDYVPTPTPMPHETPQPSEQEVILGVIFMLLIIGCSLVLLVYLMKRK